MAKNCFERYKGLKLEQQRLNDRMETLLAERERLAEEIAVDSVQASDTEFPYIQRSVTIEGFTAEEQQVRNYLLNIEIRHCRAMQIRTEKEMAKIRRRADAIQDEMMRAIVTYRFIYGMSWRQVAFRMGGGNTEDGVRMAYCRFAGKKR